MRFSYFLTFCFCLGVNSILAQRVFQPMSEKEQKHLVQQFQILFPSEKWMVSDDSHLLFDTLSSLDFDTLGYIANLDSGNAAVIEDCGFGRGCMERSMQYFYFDSLMDSIPFKDTLILRQERLGTVIFDSAWYVQGKGDSLSGVYFTFPVVSYKILQATSGGKVMFRVGLDYDITLIYQDYLLIENKEGGYNVFWKDETSICHHYATRIVYKNKRAYRKAQRKKKRKKKRRH